MVARVVEIVGHLNSVRLDDPHGFVVEEEPGVHVLGLANEGVPALI